MTVKTEIKDLEEQLRLAELGPDSDVFEKLLDDQFTLVFDNQITQPKRMVVELHKPGKAQKFTTVDMSDMEIFEHGDTAVVSTTGHYNGENGKIGMRFMRVWKRKSDGWKVIAGAMYTLTTPVDQQVKC